VVPWAGADSRSETGTVKVGSIIEDSFPVLS
jgi:hypothetical protein